MNKPHLFIKSFTDFSDFKAKAFFIVFSLFVATQVSAEKFESVLEKGVIAESAGEEQSVSSNIPVATLIRRAAANLTKSSTKREAIQCSLFLESPEFHLAVNSYFDESVCLSHWISDFYEVVPVISSTYGMSTLDYRYGGWYQTGLMLSTKYERFLSGIDVYDDPSTAINKIEKNIIKESKNITKSFKPLPAQINYAEAEKGNYEAYYRNHTIQAAATGKSLILGGYELAGGEKFNGETLMRTFNQKGGSAQSTKADASQAGERM